ncbi:DUF2849 domain-containing protein [Maritimibacter sp. HL-12]|jgi:hypothetical protein|uniref:DUF2849 domain-containing protein n=1 Tax=Maritimibacter sp. HL-12 TaxID=1162418 RepID=UPI000A0F30D9|nr:DUF2849 domain-containing protein [Maritimibacter sp. HL-12]SMH31498.1 Protein of unknown function [Maritimibacter sp. HL-12]
MAKGFRPGLVSANDLITGAVIYLASDDSWVARPEDADLITDEARAATRLAHIEAQPGRAVGAYIAPAEPGASGPRPAHIREHFRASGPSAPARASWGENHA